MKVLHLASGDLWAGAEVQLYNLASSLARLDAVNLKVVLLNHGQLEKMLVDKGVDVEVIDEAVNSSFSIYRKLNKLVSDFRPDVVHTHRVKENILGGYVAWRHNIKSVRTEHGAPEFNYGFLDFRHKLIGYLDGLAARVFQDRVVAVSDELMRKLKQHYTRSSITVIENAIDIDDVYSRAGAANERYEDCGFNVAFVGRFVPVKQCHLFYNFASDYLRSANRQDVCFHMIGDGPQFEDIRRMWLEHGEDRRIRLAGFISNVLPSLKKMDLLVFTSKHEGLPMTLLEAMALRVPVMTRNLETVVSVLDGGNCGYIVDQEGDDVRPFIKALDKILNDDAISIKSDKAHARLLENHDVNKQASAYVHLYQDVSGNRA